MLATKLVATCASPHLQTFHNCSVQCGTHTHTQGGKKSLKFRDGKVLKPVAAETHELAFYEKVAAGEVPLVVERSLVPRYFGRATLDDPDHGPIEYMLLEDLCAGFISPSILDIKMGNQTCAVLQQWGEGVPLSHPTSNRIADEQSPPHTHRWDSDCSEHKREGHIRRDAETTTGAMGFRFCGMKVWDAKKGCYRKYPKHFGWDAAKEEQMVQCLVSFLHDGTRVRADVLPTFIERLSLIEEFLELGRWRFYAASVLFIYDVEGGHAPEVRMIDFAHAWEIKEKDTKDTGFLMGIGFLHSFWKKIHARAQQAETARPKL